jgi:hypothetical protein
MALYWSVLGVLAASTALPRAISLYPHPSRMIKHTGRMAAPFKCFNQNIFRAYYKSNVKSIE